MFENYSYIIPCVWKGGTGALKPRNTLTFYNNASSDWVFRIDYDSRTVELNSGADWDDAAKLFWKHVERLAPQGFTVEQKELN